jgi:hypothetical protein
MSKWEYTVKLGDVWKNPAMTFEERRDEIVRRLKTSHWYQDVLEDGALETVVSDLAVAEDSAEWDEAWLELYALADWDRAWIDISRAAYT